MSMQDLKRASMQSERDGQTGATGSESGFGRRNSNDDAGTDIPEYSALAHGKPPRSQHRYMVSNSNRSSGLGRPSKSIPNAAAAMGAASGERPASIMSSDSAKQFEKMQITQEAVEAYGGPSAAADPSPKMAE